MTTAPKKASTFSDFSEAATRTPARENAPFTIDALVRQPVRRRPPGTRIAPRRRAAIEAEMNVAVAVAAFRAWTRVSPVVRGRELRTLANLAARAVATTPEAQTALAGMLRAILGAGAPDWLLSAARIEHVAGPVATVPRNALVLERMLSSALAPWPDLANGLASTLAMRRDKRLARIGSQEEPDIDAGKLLAEVARRRLGKGAK